MGEIQIKKSKKRKKRIEIHRWWNKALRIKFEGKWLPQWTKLVLLPGAYSYALHYKTIRDGGIHLIKAEIVVPEECLEEAKKILGIKRIQILDNPGLKVDPHPHVPFGKAKKVENKELKVKSEE